jgi:hypothetical protein
VKKVKLTNSCEKFLAFGGFNFVFNSLCQIDIAELIDRELGQMMSTVGSQYSNVFVNHIFVFFNGGDCIEDLSEHLKGHLLQVLVMKVFSPDTVFRVGKELSCPSKVSVNSVTGVIHELNINFKLNDLMVKFLLFYRPLGNW